MKLNGDLIMDEQKKQNNIRNKKSLIECRGVDVFYGDKQALFGINLDIGEKEVTSLIGPHLKGPANPASIEEMPGTTVVRAISEVLTPGLT